MFFMKGFEEVTDWKSDIHSSPGKRVLIVSTFLTVPQIEKIRGVLPYWDVSNRQLDEKKFLTDEFIKSGERNPLYEYKVNRKEEVFILYSYPSLSVRTYKEPIGRIGDQLLVRTKHLVSDKTNKDWATKGKVVIDCNEVQKERTVWPPEAHSDVQREDRKRNNRGWSNNVWGIW